MTANQNPDLEGKIKKQLYLYRVHCDMALSDRDDGVITQDEYAEIIEWQGGQSTSAIKALFTRHTDKAVTLSPEAQIALMVAEQQLKRGENPPINTTATLVTELDRLAKLNQGRGEL